MASDDFFEQALSRDVDENALKAIVASLENDVATSVPSISSQKNLVNVIPNRHNNTINGQKYKDQSDGEIGSVSFQPSIVSSAPFSVPTSFVSQTNLSQSKTITMQPPLVIKQSTMSSKVGMQPSMVFPMKFNFSMPGSIPNIMTINKPGGQNVVVTRQNLSSTQPAILPNVQFVNMSPRAPAVAAQKYAATMSPRVLIGTPQMVGTRAATPGITLQALQSLQQGQRSHLLLMSENGQYQLLGVDPASAANTLTAPQSQTLRLSTVPAHTGVAGVSTGVASPNQMAGQMPAGPVATPVPAISVATIPTTTSQPQQPTETTQKPLDNTKENCRNFLVNLLDLSSKEPKSVKRSVRNLIQELIDAQVEPDEFCDRLERLLNARPESCLIGFLKKSLPLLRQSLVIKELAIEGMNPPSPHVAFSVISAPAPQAVVATINVPMQKPPPKAGSKIVVLQNIPVHMKLNVTKVGKTMPVNRKSGFTMPTLSSRLSTVLTVRKSLLKEKENKCTLLFTQPFVYDKMAGDDDINDVAAMGGVNLAEKTHNILGSTEMIGTQIRSCKDQYLRQREANLTALQDIGPRKKPRLDGPGGAGVSALSSSSSSHGSGGFSGRSQKETAHSPMLFRSIFK
ncbi:unnamed protein product [Euphydryas editha]|uniref:TAFH domain-containing protein n=1 Tax=Euphydryas editha TaxID=104508 RepID=A0AAU9UUA7_EUPED|nr:unnamed protein product [Euphydryas editha]